MFDASIFVYIESVVIPFLLIKSNPILHQCFLPLFFTLFLNICIWERLTVLVSSHSGNFSSSNWFNSLWLFFLIHLYLQLLSRMKLNWRYDYAYRNVCHFDCKPHQFINVDNFWYDFFCRMENKSVVFRHNQIFSAIFMSQTEKNSNPRRENFFSGWKENFFFLNFILLNRLARVSSVYTWCLIWPPSRFSF